MALSEHETHSRFAALLNHCAMDQETVCYRYSDIEELNDGKNTLVFRRPHVFMVLGI